MARQRDEYLQHRLRLQGQHGGHAGQYADRARGRPRVPRATHTARASAADGADAGRKPGANFLARNECRLPFAINVGFERAVDLFGTGRFQRERFEFRRGCRVGIRDVLPPAIRAGLATDTGAFLADQHRRPHVPDESRHAEIAGVFATRRPRGLQPEQFRSDQQPCGHRVVHQCRLERDRKRQ